MKDQVDYSLYLVTDSTEAILGSRDLVDVVEQALLGGWSRFPFRISNSSYLPVQLKSHVSVHNPKNTLHLLRHIV